MPSVKRISTSRDRAWCPEGLIVALGRPGRSARYDGQPAGCMAKSKKAAAPQGRDAQGVPRLFRRRGDRTGRDAAQDRRVYHATASTRWRRARSRRSRRWASSCPTWTGPTRGSLPGRRRMIGKGDWLALRYDLTAPLARVYAQHRHDLPTFPIAAMPWARSGATKSRGRGGYRQFYQCDADTVGSGLAAGCRDLRHAGGYAGSGRHSARRLRGRVNNRKVLNGVLEAAGLSRTTKKAACPAHHRQARQGRRGGVRELLGKGREDDSGPYQTGAGLSAKQAEVVLSIFGKTIAKKSSNLERTGKAISGWWGLERSKFPCDQDALSARNCGNRKT